MSNALNITAIRIEGFRSYIAPTAFMFNNTGLHLIVGQNGAGKTSLFGAIAWCLYKLNLNGTAAAAVQTWDWMRPAGWKGTRVIMEFTKGDSKYLVARHLKYKGTTLGTQGDSSLFIYKQAANGAEKWTNDHRVSDPLYNKDAQEYLTHILGIDEYTFINSILFGQKMARLATADGKDKRKLFETLFDLDFIEETKAKATQKIDTLNRTVALADGKINSYNREIASLQNQITEGKRVLAEFEDQRQKTIAYQRSVKSNTEAELRQAELDLKKLTPVELEGDSSDLLYSVFTVRETAYRQLHAESREAGIECNQHNSAVIRLQDSIDRHWKDMKNVGTECPACGSAIPANKQNAVKQNIEEQIKGLVSEQRVAEAALKKAQAKKEQTDKSIPVAEKLMNEARQDYETRKQAERQSNNQDAIRNLDRTIAQLKERLAGCERILAQQTEAKPPSINIAQLEKQANDLHGNIVDELKISADSKAEVVHLKWWVDKAFSAKGIKANVFHAMLTKLNQYVAKYAAIIGYRIKFSVDMTKESRPFITTCYIGDKEVDYADLSGGQRQRADICLAFAMQELITLKADINLVLLDEVFESLDSLSSSLVFDMLKLKAKSKAVYVVTHSNFMDVSEAQVFNVSGGETSTIE